MESLPIGIFDESEPVITNSVLDWCREQHFINSFENYQLLTASLGFMSIGGSMVYFYFVMEDKRYLYASILSTVIGILTLSSFIFIETRK